MIAAGGTGARFEGAPGKIYLYDGELVLLPHYDVRAATLWLQADPHPAPLPAPAPDAPAPQPLCPSADLAERGRALVFDVLLWGQPARAFVLRHDGVLRGYINRCAHVPVEMDWQPGEFPAKTALSDKLSKDLLKRGSYWLLMLNK